MNPYIGITDFTEFYQVQAMYKAFAAHLPEGSNRQLHVGVMMSYKTLNNLPTKWQNIFPPKETITRIFSSNQVYNCLHYADYDNYPELGKNLSRAISYGGLNLHAVQLDMIWPDPNEITKGVQSAHKPIEVILQVGRQALEEVENKPQELAKKLMNYQGIIHRVLLDKSMGKGLGMDAKTLIPFATIIKERFPHLSIVAAGGLGPNTLHLVKPLVKLFPDLSIDAQGKLRPSGNALDPVDWKLAEQYIVRAQHLFT